MTPIQQLLLGVGGAKKTYLDDVFSMYLHTGDGNSSKTITNGINLSGEGGLAWVKGRSHASYNMLVDTVRGVNKSLQTQSSDAETTESNVLSAFNSNGFTLGDNTNINNVGNTYTSWTFRKTKGFFDIVTYTGNSTNRTISHNLGCQPGMILFKNLSAGENWRGYHRALGASWNIEINNTNASGASSTAFNNTEPTSTTFSVGTDGATNGDGQNIVAYLFAGGESTAATARSVHFDGNDYLEQYMASNTDFQIGTGDFTFEAWIKPDNWNSSIMPIFCAGSQGYSDAGGLTIGKNGSNFIVQGFQSTTLISTTDFPEVSQWTHVAVTRSGTDLKLFYNGTLIKAVTSSYSFSNPTYTYIGENSPGLDDNFVGYISNLRVVKGTAVYTSSFIPPTEPLTNITNTVLLCCNDSSATGSTVTPQSITAGGDPTASTDSPFDDPAAFTFGENGDQGIIKCGSYVGNGSATGPEINLGFEPQWILVRRANTTGNWRIWDSMRGIATGGDDATLYPNATSAEYSNEKIELTSTGFKIKASDAEYNGSGDSFIYMCIRRPDGYVGKPVDAGTDVFAMDTGASSSVIPNFDSNFPVDFGFFREPASTHEWYTGARLIGDKYIRTDLTNAQASMTGLDWDSNVGWTRSTGGSGYQAWMWKRHAGFDVVTYAGNQVLGRQIPHNLSKAPEMVWIKDRDNVQNWAVGHKGLNGGSSPWDYYVQLNETSAEASYTYWDNASSVGTAPTSTHVTIGSSIHINKSNQKYLMMLFASVDGISKVGNYSGSDSEQTISTGFAPRFIIIKKVNASADWVVLDTTRGWGSGVDQRLELNSNSSQSNSHDDGAPTSTGFTLSSYATSGSTKVNKAGDSYIYYAHA